MPNPWEIAAAIGQLAGAGAAAYAALQSRVSAQNSALASRESREALAHALNPDLLVRGEGDETVIVNYSTFDMRNVSAELYRGGRVVSKSHRATLHTPGLAPPPRGELLTTVTAAYAWLLPFESQIGDRIVLDFSDPSGRAHYRTFSEMREPGYWVGSWNVLPYR